MPARVDDVLPHPGDGHEEVGDLVAVRWPFAADVPGVRTKTGWASGGHEDLALVQEHLWQREGVPGAAAPPQRLPAHDREAQGHGRERMCHDDPAHPVKDQVASTGEFGQSGLYRRDVARQLLGQVPGTRRAPGAGERTVDGKPQLLEIHPGILPEPTGADPGASTPAHRLLALKPAEALAAGSDLNAA